MVVWHRIKIDVSVGQLLIYSVTQGTIWLSVYVNIQEGKVAIWVSLHGKLGVGMYAAEVDKEAIRFFWSMRPDHEHINVT
jgi:hypothetical protein